jgi:transcriptional regulator with XRE-family HTH domain
LAPVTITLDQRARTRIHEWIAGSNATHSDVALRIGRSPGWLSRYLNADFNADLETLRAFAAAFNQPFGALFDEPGENPAEAALIADWRALPLDSRVMLSKLAEMWARPLRRRPRRAAARRR